MASAMPINKREPLLAAPSSAPPLPTAFRRRIFFATVPILACGYAFCFVDRSNISFAELKMRHDPTLNLTTTDFAIAAGIFFAGYGVMQVPACHIVQVVGARRVLSTLLVAWGLLACLQSAIRTTEQLCWLRFALGLAEAGYYPGVIWYLTTWLPDDMLSIGTATFTMCGAGTGWLGMMVEMACL